VTAREYEKEGGITRFSLDRRITVLVMFLTLLVVGIAATNRIPVELIPAGYDEPFLRVYVPWEDAPAKEVMDKLTLPIEEELSTVKGISTLATMSRTGASIAWLRFKHGTDMDVAYREVRDRIERARVQFPDDIDRVYVMKEDASGIPVHVMGVAIDDSVSDSYNLIQNEVVMRLERIDGVASVEVNGLVEKEVLIELDRDKTSAAGLNIYQLAQDLGDDNFTMASGTVVDSSKKLLLRSVARINSLEELQNRLVERSVRLGDIATISYAQPERDFRVRAMSKPAVAVIVLKEGDANIREVSARVAQVADEMADNPRLQLLESITLFNQGEVIDEALATLLGSGLIGGLIAGCTLFLFLRRFRLTLIIATGIPASLLIGLTVMYFFGESLNLLTLLGLMLCVGLLVDNSVVVAENIHRLHRNGLGRRQACIQGAGEVGLAITMSTLTTIVVFLPVALVDGPGQFFLLRLAIPVCVSVAGSLLVALVFIPLSVYLTLPKNGAAAHGGLVGRIHDRVNGFLRAIYEATFERLNRSYNRLLTRSLQHRFALVVVVLLVFAVTGAVPMKEVKFVDMQEEERGGFYIGVEMPQSTTIEEAEAWFLEVEKVVEAKKEELGLDGWFLFHRKTFGEFQGWFARPKTVDVTAAEATEAVMEAIPKRPGFKLTTGDDRETSDMRGESLFSVQLTGDDWDQLNVIGDGLEDLLTQVPGVLGSRGSSEQETSELALVVDRQRAQQYGVNPEVVAGVVGYALRGTPLPKFRQDGKEVPVRVRFKEEDRESLTELADFPVPTASGGVLPLSALTDTRVLPTQQNIFRRDKRISRSIILELEEGKEVETRERLGMIIAAIDLPEGVAFGANVQEQSQDEELATMGMAIILSVVFIYLLMGFLFESFILPLSILFTIPLSAIGVWWTHFLMGYNIDFLGVVAIVLLVGVVVNNGIVLIDYVNRLRSKGHARAEALLTATSRRFRPIMMTAITTIGGMIPLAFAGANSIGLSYTSFALTLIGGMTTATLLTLLVVPVFYTFFDDLRDVFVLTLRRAISGAVKQAQPEGALTQES
jgi:HAE1 family hydrophobic/amphiphilic exporter-1